MRLRGIAWGLPNLCQKGGICDIPLQSVNSDTANITVDKSRDASKYPEKPLTSVLG